MRTSMKTGMRTGMRTGMKMIIALLLLGLSACASDQSREPPDKGESGITIYGQVSGSVDKISTD